MNELVLESSPYLLQHATNPIFWKAWNENTLATALKENKLIVVSIGYAADTAGILSTTARIAGLVVGILTR